MNTNGPNQKNVASVNSRQLSFVRFINKTNRKVDVIWINFEGQRVRYKILGPNEFCDVNTYKSHPWIFRDSTTHAKLIASFQEVYRAQGWLDSFLANGYPETDRPGPIIKPTRKLVDITVPMYTLKESCMDVICKCLRRLDDVADLDIPRVLKEEISTLLKV